ncbi:MAG: chromosome segregation protein SMC [Chloroflexi bacterium]|nr:MAG: chromosome segregation protein SMC [Chloroflexota bacterium]
MTRLKELRLHGFKTFADPTRFVFERGVNAVIGPNGSGKSNMADAVRWVLGEQSNRSLRTRRADDVIFAGSQARKPQGMAEAILTLDNHDRWLPIEFEEVSIGRRAYRSGETEYLVNGSRARLRDVVELLAAGRLGANELVVVGQGTVDAALSLRPDERRQLFEEAAGVKNLQVRKNESLGRLAAARANLSRVADLVGELKPQVRRLALQAQHQQEHDLLRRRARRIVIESHRRRELAARTALGEASRRAAAAEAALEARRAEDAAGRAALGAAEQGYWAAEAAARAAGERRAESREALIRAEARAESISRRVGELTAQIATAEAELEAGMNDGAGGEAAAGEANLGPARAAASDAEERWRAAVAALALADDAQLAAEEDLAELRQRHSQRIAGAARQHELLARAHARRERIERELMAAQAAERAAQAELAPATEALSSADARAATRGEQLEDASRAVDEAQGAADLTRRQAAELAERAGILRSELEAWQARSSAEGGLRGVLSAAGWRPALDGVDAPSEAWAALEAVVGAEGEDALLWRDGDLIDRLEGADGAATLLAVEELSTDGEAAAGEQRHAALAAVGATRTLAEWIGAPNLPRLVRRTVVAPGVEKLIAGWRRLPPGWSAVTAEGDLADGRGLIVVRGRQATSEGEQARHAARHHRLADEAAAAEDQLAGASEVAARARASLAEANRSRDAAAQASAETGRSLAEARTAVETIAGSLARAQRDSKQLEIELAAARKAENEVSPGGRDTEDFSAQLERLMASAADARERREAASSERDTRREEWLAARAAAEAADGAGTLEQARSDQAATVAALRAALPGWRAALSAVQAEDGATRGALAATAEADLEASIAQRGAEEERERRRAELLGLERTRAEGGTDLADLEREAQSSAIEASRLVEGLGAVGRERELALASLEVEDASTAVASSEVDEAQEDRQDLASLDDAALEGELRRVQRTLAGVGSVNPFAVEEHRELSARLESLTTQEGDLVAAISSTEELIGRLESDIAARFGSAFAAIGAKFDEFCRLLFDGGSASLQMDDAEDGEAPGGIEIAVRPPGKRLQRLAMLSGGERALTGVALLFAMLSVNPVPFCILDEVDAALDEANIGRFADALRQLAQETDFVVITHNRATIEVADTIYGVTMTDSAVSRILSLRLADLPVEVAVG